jgi:hypothetical protein
VIGWFRRERYGVFEGISSEKFLEEGRLKFLLGPLNNSLNN